MYDPIKQFNAVCLARINEKPKDICICESKCLKSLYKEINKYQFEDKPDYEKLRAMLCELRDIEKKKAQLI